MSIAQRLVRSWFASAVALLFCWITVADGQQPEQAKTPAAPPRQAAATDEAYVLRTYEVGDLVISVQDHPYSNETLRSSPRPVSGGGMGGGGGGGEASAEVVEAGANLAFPIVPRFAPKLTSKE